MYIVWVKSCWASTLVGHTTQHSRYKSCLPAGPTCFWSYRPDSKVAGLGPTRPALKSNTGGMASQNTSCTTVCSTVYSGANPRKYQSSASLAFVHEIHRSPVNFPDKWPVMRKKFLFDDITMSVIFVTPPLSSWCFYHATHSYNNCNSVVIIIFPTTNVVLLYYHCHCHHHCCFLNLIPLHPWP